MKVPIMVTIESLSINTAGQVLLPLILVVEN